MEEILQVVIHIDQELGIEVAKQLPVGATIADLKKLLLEDEPTSDVNMDSIALALAPSSGAETGRLLSNAELITKDIVELVLCAPPDNETIVSTEAITGTVVCPTFGSDAATVAKHGDSVDLADAVDTPDNLPSSVQPCAFRVMQGPLFKKPGADPATSKVIKLNRKISSAVQTTGRIWQGSAGGTWVELDASAEKPGWLLVEGPGFGIRGPLLEKIESHDEQPIIIELVNAVKKTSLGEICVKPSQTVQVAQSWISLRVEDNLVYDKIWCMKATRKDVQGGKFLRALDPLKANSTFNSLDFQEGEFLCYALLNSDTSFVEFDDGESLEQDT